jgi:NAD+ kinase
MPGTDLVMSIGGDGTILRTIRTAAEYAVPLLGINMGKLGFMTELDADEALGKIPSVLKGEGWLDKRAMLDAGISGGNGLKESFIAANDIFVGRGKNVRLVSVAAYIDGSYLTTYRADGVVVATASGSTGYALAAGGPIIYPQSREVVLQPVSAHFSFSESLILSPLTVVELKVSSGHEAVISIDGQVEKDLSAGDTVRVSASSKLARFLRLKPQSNFYSTLEERLKGKRW